MGVLGGKPRFWGNNAEKVLKVLTFSCFLVELARLSGGGGVGDRRCGYAVALKLRFWRNNAKMLKALMRRELLALAPAGLGSWLCICEYSQQKIKRAMVNVSVTAEFSQYSIVVCSGTKSRVKWAFFFLWSTATQSPHRLCGNS